ncbi:MAG: hypothetical protein M3065_13460 [Actinomycetota bacterium]|nr:hypothetical protein [Actinomycetota bacterium]
MSLRSLALAPVLAALTLAAPALADTKSVTATGTFQATVVPAGRHSNASIAAAVAAAQKRAVPGALSKARANAVLYAADAGLTLGSALSVSDAQNGVYGPFGPGAFIGPFGPGQYCGIERRPVLKKVGGRVKVVRVRKFHSCYVPRFASATLTVTFSAS